MSDRENTSEPSHDPNDPRPERPPVRVPGSSASVLKRLIGYALDCGIMAAILTPVHFLIMGALGDEPPEWANDGASLWLFILATYSLPVWCYFIWMESRPTGQTIAKRLLGLQVVSREGGSIGMGTAALRTAVKLLPWEILHWGLMMPVPAWSEAAKHADIVTRPGMTIHFFLVSSWVVTILVTEGNRAVHDFLASTFVIQKGTARNPDDDDPGE